jgi:hypothetical protein
VAEIALHTNAHTDTHTQTHTHTPAHTQPHTHTHRHRHRHILERPRFILSWGGCNSSMLLFTHYLHTHVCITYSCTRIRIQVAHTYFNGYQNSVITPFRLFRFHFSGDQLLLTNTPSPLSFHSQLEHSHPLSLARYSFDIHSIVIIKRSQLDTLTVISQSLLRTHRTHRSLCSHRHRRR